MVNLICLIFGHKREREHQKDMFGYEYVWQREYCKRCGKTLKGGRK
jgi:hypothetical protein